MAEGKRYDFERTCVDKKTAEHVRDAVINEYKDHPSWEIGADSITELPTGEYKVVVELTHKKEEKTNSSGMRF
ncbi:MAG: hypothetical protein J6O62_02045 [Bacilli bacterium]|nr:hypothetical protein [Bacilli bacterium]